MRERVKPILIGIIIVVCSSSKNSQPDVIAATSFEGSIIGKCDATTIHGSAADVAEVFKLPSKTLDPNDSVVIRDIANKLSGIEFYFVFSNSLEDMIPNLKAVLEFRNQPVPEFLEEVRTHYRITSIDEDLRLMKIECTDCETSRHLSYWDIEDGNVLIGSVEKGCGPACSYSIGFSIYRNGVIENIDKEMVMPSISLSDFLNDPADAEAIMSRMAYEMPIRLRDNGQDITVGLWLEEEVGLGEKLKGNLIPFTWNGMSFYKGEISTSTR